MDAKQLGTVDSIYIGPESARPMIAVESVRALAGRGLEGDRYFRAGDEPAEPSEEVTLIEVEPIEDAVRDDGLDVEPADMRRNIVTRGVTLRDLLGKTFTIGEVRLEALEDNPPCRHLQKLAGKPLLEPFIDKGGIRARIVQSGTVRAGDPIVLA